MPNLVKGPIEIALDVDDAGNRSRTVRYRVQRTSAYDTPDNVLTTTGLPTYGDSYVDGLGGYDQYCVCTARKRVYRDQYPEEPGNWWCVERTFTTVPPKGRCKSDDVQHPLDTPPDVQVTTTRFTDEPTLDRHRAPIFTSSHEFIRGPQNEWERSHIQVKIKGAVSDPQFPALTQMVDTVNKYTIWGFPPRTVKLSAFELTPRFLGGGCEEYADRTLTFDVKYRARVGVTDSLTTTGTGTETVHRLIEDEDYETWDRAVVDEGTKLLKGKYVGGVYVVGTVGVGGAAPNPDNPSHFIRAVDVKGNPIRVILNGNGLPAETVITGASGTGTTFSGDVGRIEIEYYGESDFALLERLPTGLFPLVMP